MADLQQHYDRYTSDDHAVWGLLFDRQTPHLEGKVWSRYLECLALIGMDGRAVPQFSVLDERLLDLTGWSIEVVKGLIPVQAFLPLLFHRRFCSSTWLRRRDQLDYLEEPDMFHDTYGHIPLLADSQYADFVHAFAGIGMRHLHDPAALALLDRFYWFTIEFGLVMEAGQLRIYGAGLISSFGETDHVYTDQVALRPFSVRDILRTPFRNDQVQNLYFVLPDMETLWESIDELEQVLAEELVSVV
jgi:phenylalanine-4-hydroxylase